MASAQGTSFWDDTETFDGEPNSWPKDELVRWLQRATGKPADSFRSLSKPALLKQVIPELDKLYATHNPALGYRAQQISLDSLLCWTPCQEENPLDQASPHFETLRQLAGFRVSGPLEREFNRMYTFMDKIHNIGTPLPMGMHPADDLRQDLLILSQAYDRDGNKATALIQTYTQEEAMSMVIRQPVMLQPMKKLRQGEDVIVIRLTSEVQQSKQQQQQRQNDANGQHQDQKQKGGAYVGMHGTVVERQSAKGSANTVHVRFKDEVRRIVY
jgi:hypothetical protein